MRKIPLPGYNPGASERNGDIDLFKIAMDGFPILASIDVRDLPLIKLRPNCHRSQCGAPSIRFHPELSGLLDRELFAGVYQGCRVELTMR